ncbi:MULTISPECIES: alpha/beta fold hydrolase [unclassified Neochlamydia]|uniref:YheT family hydrolase n=1 Tax=unclassified Neochlamydia TaxID=2643326 RepID=UPI001BCA6609|nr:MULTISPECIES: alpha/beta fold hydrolase [unclassified Neochlamydia]MBS4165472.1 putative esterase YheT [Neochlamydia sp. AcF65]MBS4169782.1 putative esterase YheT [Neochlamydia sp. AcF95]
MLSKLNFQPLFGLSSPHVQTTLPTFLANGKAPPSYEILVSLEDGDQLSCYLSNPHPGKPPTKIVVMVHGLGGSYQSGYLLRLSRKIYQAGHCAMRVNLRSGGVSKAKRPYHGGTSQDILSVLKWLKIRFPTSSLVVIGFSLGGNIVLKLAGELGEEAVQYMDHLIAVCPPVDLHHAVQYIEKEAYWIYHKYYLARVLKQSQKWLKDLSIQSMYEFDDKVTAPLWGFKDAIDYYQHCSSIKFIHSIAISTYILFAEDDPFIDCYRIDYNHIPSNVNVYMTRYGGHMGFLGWAGKEHGCHWMDKTLMDWIFSSSSC